jgi:hypothetical protein
VEDYGGAMKTNRSARKVSKFRNTMLCLGMVALVGIAFTMGQSLAGRFGQATVSQTQGAQAPNVDFGVLMASMR